MFYSHFAPLMKGPANALAAAAMQSSLTQELVILVILVAIALALIFVCGWMGRRRPDEEPSLEVAKPAADAEDRAPVTAAVQPAAIAAQEDVLTEASEQPVQSAVEPIGADSEAAEMVTAVEVADELAAAEAVKPPKPDDLKIVEGIGPKVSQLLNDAGIFTFAQLAEARVEHLQGIVDAANLRMMDPTSWPEQAKLAANGDWDGLNKLQDDLKGGRHV